MTVNPSTGGAAGDVSKPVSLSEDHSMSSEEGVPVTGSVPDLARGSVVLAPVVDQGAHGDIPLVVEHVGVMWVRFTDNTLALARDVAQWRRVATTAHSDHFGAKR